MKEDRYKIFIYDTVRIAASNIHEAHYPHKRYALFDKLENKVIGEPCFKDTIQYSNLLIELKRLEYENGEEFRLYTQEILDYCNSDLNIVSLLSNNV